MSKATCYMCDQPATTVEHVPPKSYFPKNKRENLITVPSCTLHNNATSKDDEYVRGIIISSSGNNGTALGLWKDSVRRGYINSPKLFLRTFKTRFEDSFLHDRIRVDSVMCKIGYGLYYHIYKKVWQSRPAPFYNRFLTDDGITDIQFRLTGFEHINYNIFDGSNPEVFKFQFFEGNINGEFNCYFRLIFYEGFEVTIMPVVDNSKGAKLHIDLKNRFIR
ncbi:hypothetical protein FPZ42_06070 [Mucilaginibacter achroorhodeus]|uniref:HNH endonuclease n=1 Tax=Mucilaginibacter achroorhodeus TaxID=2599294 RepID=A0A563U5H0_9SPHI|nr:hypothetical protein [Mucilaginibacter achroorhodeus]TWR26604.1 hypothetical protein FPZ42_06070 [Mucilaginibacter achroorhodeus]